MKGSDPIGDTDDFSEALGLSDDDDDEEEEEEEEEEEGEEKD